MPKINKTKYAILGVLNQNPASGYDIKKFCDKSIAHFWNENYGHIYPVLKQLEKEQFIIKQTEYSGGKPPRNIYTITETGKKILNEWLLTSSEIQPGRNEILLKLVFSNEIQTETRLNTIKEIRKAADKKLAELMAIEKKNT